MAAGTRHTRESPKPLRRAAALLLALLFGCETSPEVQHPQAYSKDGISFRYPGNWSVTEDVVKPGASRYRYLFVESPGSALVIVMYHAPGLAQSVEEFAAEFHRRTLEEVEDVALLGPLKPFRGQAGNSVPVRSVVSGMPRDGIEYSFAVSAAGERVPHRFRAFKLEAASANVFLVVQAASEDWSRVAPGFDLVLASFAVE